jgi:hypothetical protein
MRKEIAAASVIAAFLSSASPLQANLPPPVYKDTTYSPTKDACRKPYTDVRYLDRLYRSDGMWVKITENPLGEIFFINNFFVRKVYPCEATLK